jgi:hypothetical protein
MAFGSGETDFGDTGSITVAIGNAQQQAVSITMASSSIKTRVWKTKFYMVMVSKRLSLDTAILRPARPKASSFPLEVS